MTGRRVSSALIRAVVRGLVVAVIPVYAVATIAGTLATGAGTRARRAGLATDEAIRKIMTLVPRWLRRGRTRVRRAARLHEFGRWVRKRPARYRKQAGRTWTSMRRSARRTVSGGLTRLARLRGHREAR